MGDPPCLRVVYLLTQHSPHVHVEVTPKEGKNGTETCTRLKMGVGCEKGQNARRRLRL
jgi:hypothetical protein